MATNITKTFRRSFATTVIRNQLKDVVIVGAARTPMGSFRGYVTAIIFLTRASIIVFKPPSRIALTLKITFLIIFIAHYPQYQLLVLGPLQ